MRRLTAAEIGGAPGQYLAYVHRSLGYRVTCVDFSATGCAKTVENFRLLGIPGDVIQADITTDAADLPAFDVVYSLGLIEHFADRRQIVENHARLVRPGGYLVLGVPNFRGLTGWFMRTLAPSTYATHEIARDGPSTAGASSRRRSTCGCCGRTTSGASSRASSPAARTRARGPSFPTCWRAR